MKTFNKLIKSYLLYLVSAFGISLGVIANVGVSSYNSMNLAIATASGIKIGTATILFNSLFLCLYMMLTKFSEKPKYVIQAMAVLMFGGLINFFTYTVLGGIIPESYTQRLLLITLGTMIGGSAIGGIIYYNVITFPLESLCVKLSEMSRFTFVKIRYSVDIICIVISISLSLVYALPFYVREGTLISMIILSYAMNISKNTFEKYSWADRKKA
jgi:uncharacterized membrane protein YczE